MSETVTWVASAGVKRCTWCGVAVCIHEFLEVFLVISNRAVSQPNLGIGRRSTALPFESPRYRAASSGVRRCFTLGDLLSWVRQSYESWVRSSRPPVSSMFERLLDEPQDLFLHPLGCGVATRWTSARSR